MHNGQGCISEHCLRLPRHETSVLRSYPQTLDCKAVGNGAINTYIYVLGHGNSGALTQDLPPPLLQSGHTTIELQRSVCNGHSVVYWKDIRTECYMMRHVYNDFPKVEVTRILFYNNRNQKLPNSLFYYVYEEVR